MQVEKDEETIRKEQIEHEQERIVREKEATVKKQKDEILNKLSSSDIVFGFTAHLDTENKLNSSKRRLFKICVLAQKILPPFMFTYISLNFTTYL